jgi:hypothetical protein
MRQFLTFTLFQRQANAPDAESEKKKKNAAHMMKWMAETGAFIEQIEWCGKYLEKARGISYKETYSDALRLWAIRVERVTTAEFAVHLAEPRDAWLDDIPTSLLSGLQSHASSSILLGMQNHLKMKLAQRFEEREFVFKTSPGVKFPKTLLMPGQVLKLRQKHDGMTVPPGTLAVLLPRGHDGATDSIMNKNWHGVNKKNYTVTHSRDLDYDDLVRDFMYTVTYFDMNKIVSYMLGEIEHLIAVGKY